MDEVSYSLGEVLSIEQSMRLALFEAQRALPFVSPNPPVGCVILDRNYRLISTGFHTKVGAAHAEIEALKKVDDPTQLEQAIFVVTLEPCAHQGRTGSCALALSQLPIKKVVVGLQDPNPLVSGKGIEILQRAGIEVELYSGPLESSLSQVPEVFLHNMKYQEPFVVVKVATSLDGRIALETGESQWITGEESRKYSHFLRSIYDATMVGIGTFMKDDPKLDIRLEHIKKNNKVVIFDPKLASAPHLIESNIVRKHAIEDIILVCEVNTPVPKDIEHFQILPTWNGNVKTGILDPLWNIGIKSIFIEGGAGLIGLFLNENRVHRLYQFIAAKILGWGKGWSDQFSISQLDQSRNLSLLTVRRTGDDVLLTGLFKV